MGFAKQESEDARLTVVQTGNNAAQECTNRVAVSFLHIEGTDLAP